jgi:branched-chain amino acid transport system permease protein
LEKRAEQELLMWGKRAEPAHLMMDLSTNPAPAHTQWPLWLPYLAAGLIFLVLFPFLSNYLKYVITKILIYAIFAMSLNLLYGYSGLFSLGHAIFFGVGGYTAGILMIHYRVMSFWWVFPASILAAGCVAALYGLIALKMKGLFFLFTTLVLSQLTENVATKWRTMTGGSNGLVGIPHPKLGFLELADPAVSLYILVTIVFLLSLFALNLLLHSPFGEALQGIRDDEGRMAQLGYNTWFHKYIIFIISGMFAGAAGGLFGHLNGIIVPAHAGVAMSAMAMLMVIMGGPGTVIGPVLGAVAATVLELVASIYIPERWPMILGSAFVLTVLFLRGGIAIHLARLTKRLPRLGFLHGRSIR